MRLIQISREAHSDSINSAHGLGDHQAPSAIPLEDVYLSIGSVVAYDPKETLFWEDEPSDHIFKILRGTVCLYKLLADGRRQVARFCHAGDLVGLSGAEVYPYTADALTEVAVVRIRRADLDEQIEKDSALRRSVMTSINEELRSAQDQLMLLGRKSAVERVATFLSAMSEQAIRQGGDGRSVELTMTRVDIADFLGLTHETVCRVFGQLKSEGVVAIPDPHRIELSRLDALADLAEGDSDLRLCA